MAMNLPDDLYNPYAAPRTNVDAAPAEGPADLMEVEATRRKYLNHETAIRSIGTLQYLGSVLMIVGGGAMLWVVLAGNGVRDPMLTRFMIGGGLAYIAFGVLGWCLARGLRGLRGWARWTVIVMTTLSLIYTAVISLFMSRQPAGPAAGAVVFLISALVPGYILYLLVSSKGAMVFTPGYRAIVAQTPYIKYKTSLLVKILLWAFLALFLFAVGAALFGVARR